MMSQMSVDAKAEGDAKGAEASAASAGAKGGSTAGEDGDSERWDTTFKISV